MLMNIWSKFSSITLTFSGAIMSSLYHTFAAIEEFIRLPLSIINTVTTPKV